MARRRIYNVLRKEWVVMFTDPNSALLIALLPLLILGEAMVVIWLVARFGGASIVATAVFASSVAKLAAATPEVLALPVLEQFQVLLLNQLNFFLLLIPLMIAVTFSTFSIVEEKTTRTLEPLLATPVRTWELLLGKGLSGTVPALIMTWLCAGLSLVAVLALGWGSLLPLFLSTSWFLSLFLLAPGITLLSFLLGVVGSARARDARSAQNGVVVVVLPILALVGAQVSGLVWFTPVLIVLLGLAVIVADIIMLRVAVRLFRRESIVVKWQ